MIRETHLTPEDLIWPLFVIEGTDAREAIPSMPGVDRLSIDLVVQAAREARDLGIPAVCLFPSIDPALKTESCEEAWNPDNLSNRATKAIKDAVPEMVVMTDVALDPYNANGHDGLVQAGEIVNDTSVAALVAHGVGARRMQARTSFGPSDMMDGRIAAMRAALEGAGHQNIAILSYAAKFRQRLLRAVPGCRWGVRRADGRQENLPNGPRQPS